MLVKCCMEKRMASKYKTILRLFFLGVFLCFSSILINGCVWLDRPAPPKITGLPYINKDFSTITIVRRKQPSTSGIIFTLSIDSNPFVHLKHGEYTSFNISTAVHNFNVTWDIAGFALIAPYGGSLGDSPHRYKKEINIQCPAGHECFITLETECFSEFVKNPGDGVIINRVERLEGDFFISDKKFIKPVYKHKQEQF